MAQPAHLAVSGYREMMRGLAVADRDTKKATRASFRKVGEGVQVDASRRVAAKDARSAAGYKTRVRQRGIVVEQSLRKTTGRHPEWGAWQMRHALLPAAADNAEQMMADLERALDEVAGHFNRGGI